CSCRRGHACKSERRRNRWPKLRVATSRTLLRACDCDHYRGRRPDRPIWRSAGQGSAEAANDLGFLYDNGQGVPEDHAEAARWYRRAADQGNPDAEFNLGSLYDMGQGVPQDHAEAVRWFRKAAGHGDLDAAFDLGVMYEEGQGRATIRRRPVGIVRPRKGALPLRKRPWPPCTRRAAASRKISTKQLA